MLYSKPKNVGITYKEIKELAERIRRPHPTWTVDVLWNAYLALEPTKVRKSAVHTTTDLVSLVRFTLGQMNELVPYAQLVEERYAGWLLQQENLGVKSTDDQKWWLDRIKDAISQSAHFDVKDLEIEAGNYPAFYNQVAEAIRGNGDMPVPVADAMEVARLIDVAREMSIR